MPPVQQQIAQFRIAEPTGAQKEVLEEIVEGFRATARQADEQLPEGPHKQACLKRLEEAWKMAETSVLSATP